MNGLLVGSPYALCDSRIIGKGTCVLQNNLLYLINPKPDMDESNNLFKTNNTCI